MQLLAFVRLLNRRAHLRILPLTRKVIAALTFMVAGLSGLMQATTDSSAGITNGGDDFIAIKLPIQAYQALEKQRKALSAVRLEYSGYKTNMGADSVAVLNYSIIFDGRLCYESRETMLPSRQVVERSFDGRFVYAGDPENSRPDTKLNTRPLLMKYLPGDDTDPKRGERMMDFEYLNAAGFFAPELLPHFVTFSGITPLVLHYMSASNTAKIERVGENLRVTIVAPDPYLAIQNEASPEWVKDHLKSQGATIPTRTMTFLLDQEHGYAVAEHQEWTEAGKQILRVSCGGWKYYDDVDIWLPTKCEAAHFTNPFVLSQFSEHPISMISYRLHLAEFGKRKATFDLGSSSEYKKPGTAIVDRTLPEARQKPSHQVVYMIAGTGEQLRQNALYAGNRSKFSWPLLWMGLCLIGTPVLIYLVRKYKRKSFE